MNEQQDMDEQDPLFEETSSNEMRTWLQENLRVIVSVFIVGAIALGIYSYSQRTETTSTGDADTVTLSKTDTAESSDTEDVSVSSQTTKDGITKAPAEVSRETEGSFVETAVSGEGSTHLARRALMNSLEKNPDSSLTAEHKVYIEDYLRKNVSQKNGVRVGTSVEFSKTLINQAIEKSKTLNDRQLNNLKKYSIHVSTYR